MVVFPQESEFYEDWRQKLVDRGVKVRLNTEVDAVTERSSKGVKVLIRPRRQQEDFHNPTTQNDDQTTERGVDRDLPLTEESYDEIVLCTLADTSKRLLGKTARWVDRQVLGSAKWSDDITVTHTVSNAQPQSLVIRMAELSRCQDTEYMEKWYTCHFDEKEAVSTISGRDDSARVQRGRDDFNP